MSTERKRYLVIFEDDSMNLYDEVPSYIYGAVEDGYCTVVDMDTGMKWHENDWVKILDSGL